MRTDDQVRFWDRCHGNDWEEVVAADTAMIERFAEESGDWFKGRLGRVECPVLITAGRTDEVIPESAKQAVSMAAQIPDGYVFIHKAGAHPLMWSDPEDFRSMADCFLAKIEHPAR
jgi:pimeloyl-ACP methyl ester carboxylesterase